MGADEPSAARKAIGRLQWRFVLVGFAGVLGGGAAVVALDPDGPVPVGAVMLIPMLLSGFATVAMAYRRGLADGRGPPRD